MQEYFRILFWTIAFEGILMASFAPQGCILPNHPFAFALAPCLGGLIATARWVAFRRLLGVLATAYFLALGIRVWWTFNPWWNYDLGLCIAVGVVPAFIAAQSQWMRSADADRNVPSRVGTDEFRRLMDEHRRHDAE